MTNQKQGYRLLIVEDDDREIEKYNDAIFLLNKDFYDIEIIPSVQKNLLDGKRALAESDFDGALVDLKLSSTSANPEDSGNAIIKEIKSKLRFPVVIYSAFTNELDPEYRDETCFFKIYSRTDKISKDIFEELVNLHRMGITNIIGREGLIDKFLNNIYWNYLSKAVSDWNDIQPDNLEKMMLRYTISHLQEYLEIDDDGKFEKYHPYEMYIIPPIKKKPFTGTIIKRDEKYSIILTPACDLAQDNKTKLAVMADIEKIEMDYVEEQKLKIRSGINEKIEDGKKILFSLITNTNSLKYHFLPPCQSFKGGFINFQKIQHIKIKEIIETYDLVASISSSYIKDIVARFSHYYSRQGQPDMDFEKILSSMLT